MHKRLYYIADFIFILIWWIFNARLYFTIRFWGVTDYITKDLDYSAINLIGAMVIGSFIGMIELTYLRKFLRSSNFFMNIITKTILYCIVIFLGVGISSFLFHLKSNGYDFKYSLESAFCTFYSRTFITAFIWGLVSNILLNTFRDMKSAFGPKIFWKRILGVYHQPKEENRVFMFIDLVDSTTIAEKMGHIKYSNLLKDCYYEISEIALEANSSVYQYVGDEAVLTWKINKRFKYSKAINCYFSFITNIQNNNSLFLNKYELVPHFRASIHAGKVASTEVGEVKREIAYHGDVLNTASRIQECCRIYDKDLLISQGIVSCLSDEEKLSFDTNFVSNVSLKGKKKKIKIYSVLINSQLVK